MDKESIILHVDLENIIKQKSNNYNFSLREYIFEISFQSF